MEATTQIIQPPRSGVGEDSSKIAVAVLSFAEKTSMLFCLTFEKAMVAGLRRSSVVVVESVPVYNETFAVAVITVPASQRAATLASAKETLAELDLLEASTIAMDRAGDSWIILHGIGTGGVKFGDFFLRPDFLEGAIAALEKWHSDRQIFFEILIDDCKRSLAALGEGPETP